METISVFEDIRFGILLIAVVLLIVKTVFRSAAATSDEADDPDTANAPAKSAAGPDAQAGKKPRSVSPADKARARMAMQKHVSARKAELQAKRANREAAQMIPSLEGPSLEGPSLEGPSLEGPSLEGPSLEILSSEAPAKHRQQAAVQQPERSAASSSADRNEWMEGFDIRRAVVWSEILRPKFKEDEA